MLSWWAKIRSRLLLCCRATRTSIHSLHSMTERRDRQSPSPKMPKKSTEQPCGNCVTTGGNNTGNNCSSLCGNRSGNSCGIDCGDDCQKCGEGATLVGPSCYSLLPAQSQVQEHGVEELIELQERNHVSPSPSPAFGAAGGRHLQEDSLQANGSQNKSNPKLEAGSQPASSTNAANKLLEGTGLDLSGDRSMVDLENKVPYLIPKPVGGISRDGTPVVDGAALDSDGHIDQKSTLLKSNSDVRDVISANHNNLVKNRANVKDKKEGSELSGSNGGVSGVPKPLGAWEVGGIKDGADSVSPRNYNTFPQDLNPLMDPLTNLENGRRELSGEQLSCGVNASENFDAAQLGDKTLSSQMALGDTPNFESDSAKKKERPSKVKYCGESNVATTVIASEDQNKEDKDETML